MARSSRLLAGVALGLVAATPFAARVAEAAPGFASHPASSGYPACSTKPTTGESEKASDVYRYGKIAFDEGEYDKSLVNFREAYQRDCSQHQLLLVIARAYELKGDKLAAADALKVYLERTKAEGQSPPDLETHRRREAKLRADAAASPQPTPAPTATEKPAPAPAPTATEAPPSSTEPPPAATEERGHTVYPWLVVGAGGLAITSGLLLFAVGGSNFPSECQKGNVILGVKGTCDGITDVSINESAGSAQGAQTAGFWTMVGGALLVGGGLAWHFLEPTGPRDGRGARSKLPAPVPVVGPGFAGASWAARF